MALFIAINAIVSATVTLLVLSTWDAQRPRPEPIPTLAGVAQVSSTPLPNATTLVPTEPPAPAVTPTPSGPFVYAIESGDTLGGLALRFDVPLADLLAANDLTEDAILSVGQELTIPVGSPVEPTPTPDNTPPPTPAATSGPALVVIREIELPGSVNGETIILTNLGEVINLAGWTLSDGRDNRYTFPDVTLFAGAEINLHTREGANSPTDLYWGASAAVWGETGTVAYLRDANGRLVATYRVP
jgi:LysM repeat protein